MIGDLPNDSTLEAKRIRLLLPSDGSGIWILGFRSATYGEIDFLKPSIQLLNFHNFCKINGIFDGFFTRSVFTTTAKLKQALAILHALPTHQLLLGLCHHESIHSLKFEKGNEDFSPAAPHLIDFFCFLF